MGFLKRCASVIICICLILCAAPLCPFASAQAQTPLFRLNEISNDSDTAVVSLELVSGGFNCVDFRFSFENVVCTKIKKGEAYNAFASDADEAPFISYNTGEVPEDCYNLSIISPSDIISKVQSSLFFISSFITDILLFPAFIKINHCRILYRPCKLVYMP